MKKRGKLELSKEIAEYKLKKITKEELKKNILSLLKEDSTNKKHELDNSFLRELCTNQKLPKQMLSQIEKQLLNRKGNDSYNTKVSFIKIRNEIEFYLYTINVNSKALDTLLNQFDKQSDFANLLIDEINKGNNTEKTLCHAMNYKKYAFLRYPKTPSSIRKILQLLESGGYIVCTKDRPKKYVTTNKTFLGFEKEKKATPAKP